MFLRLLFLWLDSHSYMSVHEQRNDNAMHRGMTGQLILRLFVCFTPSSGFDSVTCQAEETKNPQRDLPIGIIGSLAISTVLYVAVSLVLVGMVPYTLINIDAPLSDAFGHHGLRWAEFIIALGAIVGITSVLLVTLMGQSRILMAMARDGLLPESFFGAIHPKYATPYKSTILTGVIVAVISSLIPLSVLVELVSIGTLLAFTIVCLSIIILRRTAPNVPRPFLCPWVPVVPGLGAFVCIMLMLSLPSTNWLRLIGWLGIGMLIYVFYGHANAKRVQTEREASRSGAPSVELMARLPADSAEVSFGAHEYEATHSTIEDDEPNPFEDPHNDSGHDQASGSADATSEQALLGTQTQIESDA
jgi:amino acid transporter